MSYDKETFQLVRHALKPRRLLVESTKLVTPRMRRVVLTGPDLEGFASLAPEDHVKLFFPHPGESRPQLPVVEALGLVLPKPALGKVHGRDYTPLSYDSKNLRLTIDFFLHDGGGVAAAWARQARPGQELGVLGPRGSYVTSRRFGEYLLFGDETALPEIEGRLGLLEPRARAQVVLLVTDEAERRELTSAARLDIRWIYRAPHLRERLLHAVSDAVPEAFSGFAWLAGEAGEVRAVYEFLLRARGVDPKRVRASGHWKRGVVNHDHHEPITVGAAH